MRRGTCYMLVIVALTICTGICATGIQTRMVKADVQGTQKSKTETQQSENRKSEESKSDENTDLPQLQIGSSIFEPYFYVGEDGNYAGVDVEIATEACKRMGYKPVFTELIWGEHDRLLEAGMIDCIWCSFAMNGRERKYQWAGPYLYSPEVVVVPADSDIESLEDLEGKSIAVEIDSRPEDYFLNEEEGVRLNVKNVQTYSSLEDAFTSFGKGYADAVTGHKMSLESFTSQKPELYRYLEPPIIHAKLGVAFSNEDKSGVVTRLSEVLDEMNEDGAIEEIVSGYGFGKEMLIPKQNADGGSE